MIQLKEQYPFVEDNLNINPGLIKHWAEDENGKQYFILQKETGIKYYHAVDVFPCVYTYEATSEPIDDEGEEVVETFNEGEEE